MTQLRRTAATAAAFGLDCELLTPAQAADRYPIMRTDDLVGAIWLPGDGRANPTDLTASLARGARQGGARIFERTRVLGVSVRDGRVTGVATDAGDIAAEVVVNCAGQWAKQVGALAGVNVPLHSAEHFYVVTDPIDGVHTDLPVLRDPDGYTYFKEEVGGLVVGGFEPEAKPWVAPDQIPYPFEFRLLDEDWDHFTVSDGERAAAHPRAAHHRHQEVLQRTGELHARQPVHPGRGPRGAQLLRRGRAQLGRHRHRRGSGPGAGGVDRGRRARDGPHRGGHQAVRRRSTGTTSGCTTGSRRCSACTTRSPGRTARCAPPGPFAARPSTTCCGRPTPTSAAGWAGSGPTSSRRRASLPRSSTPGASRTGCPGPRPSSAPPARRSPCSTRPRSPSSC